MDLVSNSTTLSELESVISSLTILIAPVTLLALVIAALRYLATPGDRSMKLERLIENAQRILAVSVACSLMASATFIDDAMEYFTDNRGQAAIESSTGSSLSPQDSWSDIWSGIETDGFIGDRADNPLEEAITGSFDDAVDGVTASPSNVGAQWAYALDNLSRCGVRSVDELMANHDVKKTTREYGIRDFEDPILYDPRFQSAAVEAVDYAEGLLSDVASTTPAEIVAGLLDFIA